MSPSLRLPARYWSGAPMPAPALRNCQPPDTSAFSAGHRRFSPPPTPARFSLRRLPTFPATSIDPTVLYTEVLARWATIRRHRRLSSRWKSFRSEKPSVAPPSNRPAPSSLHDSTRLQIGSHPRKSPLAPVLRRSVLANPSLG